MCQAGSLTRAIHLSNKSSPIKGELRDDGRAKQKFRHDILISFIVLLFF